MDPDEPGTPAFTRRSALGKLGAGAVGTIWGAGESRAEAQSNTLTITKQGARDGVARYRATVSGELEATDDFEDHGTDDISGPTATGRVGPAGGLDRLRYSGRITSFSLTGPAVVYRNGERVDPDDLGDGSSPQLPNTLTVTKEDAPAGVARYRITVSGELEATDDFEGEGTDDISADGKTAIGRVGPEGGLDRLRYTGRITEFRLTGPASVLVNGRQVDPHNISNGGGGGELKNTLTITKEGAVDGVARYEVTVSGRISPGDDFEQGGTDIVSRTAATGRIGPKRGIDTLAYSGEITSVQLEGPATLIRNGEEVDESSLGSGTTSETESRLTVTKEDASPGIARYELTVAGEVTGTNNSESGGTDSVGESTARGRVGPEGGTDTVRFTGDVVTFRLEGPATLLLNGHEVTPSELRNGGTTECLVDRFRRFSSMSPGWYCDHRKDLGETAEDAELNYWLSSANIAANKALQTLAEYHYGNYSGATREFLGLIESSTRRVAEANSEELFQVVHGYSEQSLSVYELVHDDTRDVFEYARLVDEAHKLKEERDLDSMLAALELGQDAFEAVDEGVKSKAILVAVETAELPLESASAALELNAQEQLALKAFAESQLPILHELERLAQRRVAGSITEREAYSYFIYWQEYWSAFARFTNQIHQLEKLGRENSIFFTLARFVGNELLGNNVLESSRKGIQLGVREYEEAVREMAEFRRDVQGCP